jgi:hypothetical protein
MIEARTRGGSGEGLALVDRIAEAIRTREGRPPAFRIRQHHLLERRQGCAIASLYSAKAPSTGSNARGAVRIRPADQVTFGPRYQLDEVRTEGAGCRRTARR